MKIGPKFKIAKRLGAPIFEKTQTAKYALSEARATRSNKRRRPGQMSNYKRQLIEKQKMRFTYGVSERQLRKYVNEAVSTSHQPISILVGRLESRLDNVVYRLGLAKTRSAARQMVSHGHICVNGRKVRIPSYEAKVKDVITVRDGSKETGLFSTLTEDHEAAGVPNWLTIDIKNFQGVVKDKPAYEPAETLFDPEQVLEYYSR
jgi:small subunit ribosomal protein S4